MTTALSASIKVAGDVHAAASARRQISAALQAGCVGNEVSADVELLVSELVSDLSRHANGAVICVDLAIDVAGSVTVTVAGGAEAPSPELLHPAGPAPTSGRRDRALLILDSVASTWGTRREHGKTTVWFTIDNGATVPGSTTTELDAPAAPAAQVAGEPEVLITEPEVLVTRAAVTAERAAADAALTTATAARRARGARAAAATLAAAAVADAAARTVDAVQAQADELASAVASAAAEAATTVSRAVPAGGDADAARVAGQVGAMVLATAVAKAEETARAAILVARAVAAAAAAVASTTAEAAAAIDDEVLDAAAAVRAVTSATARELAADTVERRATVAWATHEAAAASAAASELLHEANRQLQRAGRHDRKVALALQEAMLTRLPDCDDIHLAARYLTAAGQDAADQDQVGGDWYDAITLSTGFTTLVIGDVIGHDIEAAATMGQLRNILRALVWERNQLPSDVVNRLDRAIRDLRIDTMATLILVNMEPPAAGETYSVATLRWSNAGHPAPILIDPDGTAVILDETSDLLLGVIPDTVRRDHTHPVPPGATLLLYTDGLIETRTASIDHGQRRLLHAVQANQHRELGDLLDAVLTDVVGDRPGDDVAVLAARFPHISERDRPDLPC